MEREAKGPPKKGGKAEAGGRKEGASASKSITGWMVIFQKQKQRLVLNPALH